MSIPPQEAAGALHDIEHAHQHSVAAYHYQKFSPYLFLWGVIWIVGYALVYLRPQWALTWPVLMVAGFIGTFWISMPRGAGCSRAYGWRMVPTLLVLFLFITALLAILPPKSGAQIGALIPLLIAVWYALLGIWKRATRIAVLGLALGALTVGGYFWLPQYFPLWMSGFGGGALILGGVWLRRV